jgi:hypothetical protein
MERKTAWYECGEIGEQIRDVLDYYDDETCVNKMKELGLSDEEIVDVFAQEAETYDE